MSMQTIVRISAWCIGAFAVGVPVATVLALGDDKHGEGIESMVRALWIATLVGIPCILVGLKGIQVGPEANRARFCGVLAICLGVMFALIGGLITYLFNAVGEAVGWGSGFIETGLIVLGMILVYAGVVTVISGVDLTAELRK